MRGLNIRNSAGELAPGIDIRGVGGYVVLPPSLHSSGNAYRWANGNEVLDLPEYLEKKLQLLQVKPSMGTGKNGAGEKIPHGQRNRFFVKQAGRYRRNGDTPEIIYRKLVVDYETRCEQTPLVDDSELRAIAQWSERFTPAPETAGPPKANIPPEPPLSSTADEEEPLTIGSGREDTSNAARFVTQHKDSVRFCHGRAKWMLWSSRWTEDQPREVQELAKATAKSIFLEAASLPDEEAKAMGKWAEKSLGRERINAMLELAKSDPRIRMTTDQFDRDPLLLNFTNGTFDIRTETLREHRRGDYITKLIRHDFLPDLIAPTWLWFLKATFGELADWVQKAFGYGLTGDVSEKVAFLLLGRTNTGKSTFVTTLREIFKDYSALLQIETLMHSGRETNTVNSDLSDLRGVRFVVTSETEENHRLREARLKYLVKGMGEIKSRRLYENQISFQESHKIWIDANHAPRITGTDDAIWDRLLPIPCNHQVIDGKDLDRGLPQKLLHEAPGIVSWAVAGAVRWHKEGLGRPKDILDARAEWRERMDLLGQFLTECCDLEGSVRAGELYDAFKVWCEKQGYEHIMTATAFGLRLVERKFEKKHTMKGAVYFGIRLKGGLF
jgi:putative DNA primase/helicase